MVMSEQSAILNWISKMWNAINLPDLPIQVVFNSSIEAANDDNDDEPEDCA